MHRACFEWTAILCGVTAVITLGWYPLTLVTNATDLSMTFGKGPRSWDAAVCDGSFVLCDSVNSIGLTDSIVDAFGGGDLASGNGVPGLVVYRSAWRNRRRLWSIKVNLLIIVSAFSLLAWWSYGKYRELNRVGRLHPASHASNISLTDD